MVKNSLARVTILNNGKWTRIYWLSLQVFFKLLFYLYLVIFSLLSILVVGLVISRFSVPVCFIITYFIPFIWVCVQIGFIVLLMVNDEITVCNYIWFSYFTNIRFQLLLSRNNEKKLLVIIKKINYTYWNCCCWIGHFIFYYLHSSPGREFFGWCFRMKSFKGRRGVWSIDILIGSDTCS